MSNEMNFKNITHDGQTWRIYDEGEGTAVVLFHGFPDSPHTFAPVAVALQQRGYRTIIPYLRGYHPDTIMPGRAYDAKTISYDGIRLLDALKLEQAIIIGHDWGASISYGIAAFAPERVKALITIAIPNLTSLKPNLKAVWALRHFFYFKAPFAEWRTKRNNFAYLKGVVHRLLPNGSPDEVNAKLSDVRTLFSDPAVLTGMLDYYRGFSFNIDDKFREKRRLPSLLIAGSLEVEEIGGIETYHRSAAAYEPKGDIYIMEGAVHSPHEYNLDEFMVQIDNFFAARGL